MNYQGNLQDTMDSSARKQTRSSFDFLKNDVGSGSQYLTNSSPSNNTDYRYPYPTGTFSKPNANLSQSLNHKTYSDPASFDGISKYTNKTSSGFNATTSSLNSRYQVPNAKMMDTIKANCIPSRNAQKEKLVNALSSDANVAILPGYNNSERNNHYRRSLGSISSAPQLGGPIAPEPLLPVERPPSAVSRAQAAIGLTKAHVRDAQNLLSTKSNANTRSKKPNPWNNPFGDQDPLLAKRSKQATYRRDLLRQIEQSQSRKDAEKLEERQGVQEHPLGPGYNVKLPYSSHNNEIKVESFAPYITPRVENRTNSQLQNSTPRNEIIGKAVPSKFTRKGPNPQEINPYMLQQHSQLASTQHPQGLPSYQNPAQMPNQFYPPPPCFYPYGYPPNMPHPPQPFPSFPPYQMPLPPIPPPPPLFQQPYQNLNPQQEFRTNNRPPMPNLPNYIRKDRVTDQGEFAKEKFCRSESPKDEADVELDESVFRHHVWQTSDQLPDQDLKTAAYKTELRKQIRMNQRRKEEEMLKEKEEDEKLDKKIEEYQREIEAQLREEREQATILLKQKRTNGSLGIKVNHNHIVVGKPSYNSFPDESFPDNNMESRRPPLQKRQPVTLKDKVKQTNNKHPTKPLSTLDLLTNESNISSEGTASSHSDAQTMSETSSVSSLGSTVIDSNTSIVPIAAESQMTMNENPSLHSISSESTLLESNASEASIISTATTSKTKIMNEKSSTSSIEPTDLDSKVSEASIYLGEINESVSGNDTPLSTTCTNSLTFIYKNLNCSLDSPLVDQLSTKGNSLIDLVSGVSSSSMEAQVECNNSYLEEAQEIKPVEVEAGSIPCNSTYEASTVLNKNQTSETSLKTESSNQGKIPYEERSMVPTPFDRDITRTQHPVRKLPSLKIIMNDGNNYMSPNIDPNKNSGWYNNNESLTCSSQQEPNLVVKCSSDDNNNSKPLDKRSNSNCLLQIQKYLELEASRVETLLFKYRTKKISTRQSHNKKIHGIKKNKKMKLFNRIIRRQTASA